MAEIRLSARCYPTEDRETIIRSIKSLFPDAKISGDDPITGTCYSLANFSELLKRQRIRMAARKVLRRGAHGNQIVFKLNKQVAAVGKISFSEEAHPLGDIDVIITSDDVQKIVDDIAPDTRPEVARS